MCVRTDDVGTMGHVFLLILCALVLVALVWSGVRLLWAGRQLDDATPTRAGHVPVAPADSLAAKVDDRLQRARTAVDTLIQPDVTLAETRPSRHATRERATTYAMFGLGLVGIAAFVVIGLLLLGS